MLSGIPVIPPWFRAPTETPRTRHEFQLLGRRGERGGESEQGLGTVGSSVGSPGWGWENQFSNG